MTRVMQHLTNLDAKGYAIVSGVVLALVAVSVFQIMPPGYLQVWGAMFSGATWMISGFVILSGRHVPLQRAVPFALILAGLTLTIPTMRIDNPTDAPVYLLGTTLARIGFLSLATQAALDLYRRFKAEREK